MQYQRLRLSFAALGTADDSAAERGLLSHAAPRLTAALGVSHLLDAQIQYP